MSFSPDTGPRTFHVAHTEGRYGKRWCVYLNDDFISDHASRDGAVIACKQLNAAERDRYPKSDAPDQGSVRAVSDNCPTCAARPSSADRGEWCGNGECSAWTRHPPPTVSYPGSISQPDA